jgi:DNA polymerase III alpha subunit
MASAPACFPCAELARHRDQRVELCGWLVASRPVRTSAGRWMRFLTLEDESGIAEVVLFPSVYARAGHRLVGRGPFRISGRVEDPLGAGTLHAERIG